MCINGPPNEHTAVGLVKLLEPLQVHNSAQHNSLLSPISRHGKVLLLRSDDVLEKAPLGLLLLLLFCYLLHSLPAMQSI